MNRGTDFSTSLGFSTRLGLSTRPALLVFVLLLGAVACSKASGEFVDCHIVNPDGSKTGKIQAELARTPSETSLGLMYRKELPKNQGMLFVFPDEKPRSFWMKNTYIPLDIIYFSAEKRIVSISKQAQPLTTTARPSGKPAKYVLEVNAGLADLWKLQEGSKLVVADEKVL